MIEGREISDKRFQINSLDGLRGFAVLAVFLSHTSNKGIFLFPNVDFSGIGKSGVFLFFVLSAFLLTMPFIEKGKQTLNSRFLANYAIRRFSRIYPLYFIYLTLGLATSVLFTFIATIPEHRGVPFYLSVQDFWEHIILVQGKGVTWSILVECRYYLILPVLGVFYSVLLKNRVILSAGLTAVLIIAAVKIWPNDVLITNDSRLGPYLPTFFMGSFLAVLTHAWRGSTAGKTRWAPVALDVLGLLSLALIVAMTPSVSSAISGVDVPYNYFHRHYVLFGLLWFVVVFACVSGHGVLRRAFELPFLRYLGFVSFSFYLIHVVVIAAVNEICAGLPAKGWLMFGVTIAASHLSWMLIEKPSAKIRLKRNPQQSVVSDSAAAKMPSC